MPLKKKRITSKQQIAELEAALKKQNEKAENYLRQFKYAKADLENLYE